MKLPMELRQRVYRFHFQQEKRPGGPGKDCPAGEHCVFAEFNNSVPVQELIRANKLIYDEAMPVYYRNKVFIFNSCGALRAFLSGIGPFQRSYIAHVCVRWSGYTGTQAFRLLAGCPRLRYLNIGLARYFRGAEVDRHPRTTSLMRCASAKFLLQIRGLSSVDFTLLQGQSRLFGLIDVEIFEEALQTTTQPRKTTTTGRGSARAFALLGTPRSDFAAPRAAERSVIMTRAKRIKLDMA